MKDHCGWKKTMQTLLVFSLVVGMFAACASSVCAAGKKVAISATKMTLRVGQSKKLTVSNAKKVTWKSSAKAVASVNKNGKVTAKKAGSATITARAAGKKLTCRVTVKKAAPGQKNPEAGNTPEITRGNSYYRGFLVDNVFHSKNQGDIHYHVYFPDSYDGKAKHALYITLPGYQGLYFQGVAENLKTEDFAIEAQKYCSDMVIVAPQLDDWGRKSADQTTALTQYFLSHYAIDPARVYINGYSGGGETLSLVLGEKPELYTAALMCSSQWDGGYDAVVKTKTPVYFVIGEDDEYYGSGPFKQAYRTLHDRYEKQGLSEQEIDRLLVLDVKGSDYFAGSGIAYQHGGGYLFCRDKEIMGWLFQKR